MFSFRPSHAGRRVSPVLRDRPPALPEPVTPRPPPDLAARPADPALIARIGPAACLRLGVLPWRRQGAATILLAGPRAMARQGDATLDAAFGATRFWPVSEEALQQGQIASFGAAMARAAETRVPEAESCRSLPTDRLGRLAAAVAAAVLGGLVLAPGPVLALLGAVVLISLLATTALKIATLAVTGRARQAAEGGNVTPVQLPVISLLVPLFREREVAGDLLRRLEALDYPRDRLDLCLILEEEDATTAAALAEARLPDWAQVVVVPAGSVRTKPRALNHALLQARGTILGVYDAEDAPAPDQLRRVADRFAAAPPEVACLQGMLDYYNARTNWIARCFTLEYASWFRVMLPGLARLGLVVPLGGTTLFLRREALEAVGGWDAHNVTEDADLGLRLARYGFRTELVATVTEEEANARAWPWVRQRTRWLKGYAMTWAVHMRDPARLWRELGTWRFLGVQVLFLGTLVQFLLAPVFWSLWLVAMLLPGLAGVLAAPEVLALLLLPAGINAAMAGLGVVRAGKARLMLWIPLMALYYPLATVAAWRGLAEILSRPFFWDKTAHGVVPGRIRPSRAGVIPRPGPFSRRA